MKQSTDVEAICELAMTLILSVQEFMSKARQNSHRKIDSFLATNLESSYN